MKILFVVAKEKGGGAEEVTKNWIKFLESKEYDISMISLADSSISESEIPSQLSVFAWGDKRLIDKILSLRNYVRTNAIDTVVSVLTFQNIVTIIALLGTRTSVIISEHNVPSVLLLRQGISQRMQYRIAKVVYRIASGCIAVSHAVAADLRCTFDIKSDRMAILPNSVLTRNVESSASSPYPGSDKSVHTQNQIQLLIPARLVEQKCPRHAIQVSKELIDRGYHVSTVFVGDGPLKNEIIKDARDADVPISIHSWTEDWMNLAGAETVVLLPSTVEGFGNILVHAASHGIPSVASSVALGVGDALVEGITGSLAETYTAESFCDAIERALKLESKTIRSDWLNRFQVDNVGVQFERFLLSRGLAK